MPGIDLAAGLRYPVPAVRVGIGLWIVLQILGGKVATQEVVQSPAGAFRLADQVLVANREEVGAFQIGSDSLVVLEHLPEQFVPPLTLFEPLGRVPQASRVTHVVDDLGLGVDREQVVEVPDVRGPLVADDSGVAAAGEIGQGRRHGLAKIRGDEETVPGQSPQDPSKERLGLGVPYPRPTLDVRFGKAVPPPLFGSRIEDAGARVVPESVALPDARDLGVLI